MSATSAPFGLRPVYHPTGLDRAREYGMSASYNTAIYKFSPVALVSNLVNLASAGSNDWLGSFAGVTYTDSTGKPVTTNFWPGAVTGATNITAWVYDDPNTVYEIQSSGSIAAGTVGQQINFDTTIGNGSTATGLSAATVTATPITSGSQGQCQIVDISLAPTNAWGDAFTVLHVRNARHQFVANKVAV